MVKRYNRLLIAFHVITDALLAAGALVLAYSIRFESGLTGIIPITKGQPPLRMTGERSLTPSRMDLRATGSVA